jgi:cutinase
MQLITLIVASLAALATAAPQGKGGKSGGGKLGGGGGKGGSTRNDLSSGCKPVIFINARATGEAGNFGGSTGPGICQGLSKKFSGQVACQGVGGE